MIQLRKTISIVEPNPVSVGVVRQREDKTYIWKDDPDYMTDISNLKEKRKNVGGYNRIENCVSLILWSAFWYLTLFNMAHYSGRSILFLHMRVVTDWTTIVYAGITVLIVILSAFVFPVKRTLFADLFAGLIPTGLTLSIYYVKTYLFAKATLLFAIVFFLLGAIGMIHKNSNKEIEYTKAYVSVGVLCLISSVSFIYGQIRLDRGLMYKKPVGAEIIDNAYEMYPSFRWVLDQHKDEVADASEENLIKLGENWNKNKAEELLQKLLDYQMEYLGVQDRLTLVVDDQHRLLGDNHILRKGNIICISEDYIRDILEKKENCFYAYREVFQEGSRYYWHMVAEQVLKNEDKSEEESPLLFYKKMRAMQYAYRNYLLSVDTELLSDGYSYNEFMPPMEAHFEESDVAYDCTYDLYFVANGRERWESDD